LRIFRRKSPSGSNFRPNLIRKLSNRTKSLKDSLIMTLIIRAKLLLCKNKNVKTSVT